MPNWCEGILKVRGTKSDVKKWAKEALQPMGESKTKQNELLKWTDDENEAVVQHSCWIKDSRRGFVQSGSEINFWNYEDCDDDDQVIIMVDAKFAWYCDTLQLAKSSKEYGVDYYFYGFEAGMGFEQRVEIINGAITIDEIIDYANYAWESINPMLGG